MNSLDLIMNRKLNKKVSLKEPEKNMEKKDL